MVGLLAPLACRYVAPGRALSLETVPSWPFPRGRRVASLFPGASLAPGEALPASPGDLGLTWEDLDGALAPCEETLAQARRYLGEPALHARLDYQVGWSLPLPHLAALRNLGGTLNAAFLLELHARRREAALENLEALLGTVRALASDQLVISQSVRHRLAQVAFSATWQALQHRGWTDAQLARLQQRWQEFRFLEASIRALEMERAVMVETYSRARESASYAAEVFQLAASGSSGPGPGGAPGLEDLLAGMKDAADGALGRAVVVPLWQFALSAQDELDYLQGAQAGLDAGRAALRSRHSQAVRDSVKRLQEWRIDDDALARLRLRMSSLSLGNSGRFLAQAAAHETLRELVVAALALERFRLRHGRWPERLEELVPDFAASPPWDYAAGAPLRYRVLQEDGFLLYGVGGDGIDDGGQGDSASKDRSLPSLNPITTRDAVWPAACSPGETRAALEDMWKNPSGWSQR